MLDNVNFFLLLKNKLHRTPLHYAVFIGDNTIIKILIFFGAEINHKSIVNKHLFLLNLKRVEIFL